MYKNNEQKGSQTEASIYLTNQISPLDKTNEKRCLTFVF